MHVKSDQIINFQSFLKFKFTTQHNFRLTTSSTDLYICIYIYILFTEEYNKYPGWAYKPQGLG